ncbi:MAG: hypothetical protein ACXIVQ_13780 [Acidimicrobiales bacterium]
MTDTSTRRPVPLRRAVLTALAAVAALVGFAAGPASAHGGPGDLEMGEPADVGPLEIEFPIRVTYQNDGHDAEEIEGLRVVAIGEDGAAAQEWLDPSTPGDAPGVFVVRLLFDDPGDYDLQITIDEPESSGALLVSVTEPTTDPAPDAPSDDAPGDDAPDTTDATDDGEGEDVVGVTAVSEDESDDDGGLPLWVLLGAGLVVGTVIGLRMARSRSTATPEE